MPEMTKIKWKQGSHYTIPPETAHKAIEAVRRKNGGDATAEAIVAAAAAKRNPLHPEFTWDDSQAAKEYRLGQARYMMRSLVIVRDDLATKRPQRVYEVVRAPQVETDKPTRIKHVYRTVEDIMADPDTRQELLGRALKELISLRTRYRDLQELAVVIRAIDEVIEKVSV